ncbi:probable LRR receptor-like serine/threonine-protein kinase At1g12460 [Rutidosis leptorrhynchoides]|uniref:probable LRR receptor-like serine/threonine-protein kinase At1g12460 n=1 Tax=Rutidosis leptorrhynchoides TaxID=125765 RepID=UPI003A997A38
MSQPNNNDFFNHMLNNPIPSPNHSSSNEASNSSLIAFFNIVICGIVWCLDFIILWIIISLSTTTTTTITTEKEILLQFKGNITSDPYNSLVSWDLYKDQCRDYSGVFCDSFGNINKIVLWNTSLGGVLSPALSKLKSLRILTLFGNRFTGNIPTEFQELTSLWKINVSSNALSGSIPEFLGDLPSIRFLDLSKNEFQGEIPSSLFRFCEKIKFISLSHNNLSSSVPIIINNCLNLEGFDVSFNSLSGEFPSQICEIPNLVYLSLRNNALTGSVDEQVKRCQRLELLDLGSNLFNGIPPFRVLGLANLSYFNISYNKFDPRIQMIPYCSEKLEVFDVAGNGFQGDIPTSIVTQCSGLKVLNMGYNRLTGEIPVEISNLTKLTVIKLGNNSISSEIPEQLGSIELLQVLDLHNLDLQGGIPDTLSNCRFLLELDLSGNNLQGRIPETFYNMSYLKILDLHKNNLSGSIPSTLGNLSKIQTLDLSENSLSGSIPLSLTNLSNLNQFNVSYNDLSGRIPSFSLQNFNSSVFSNNLGLCGPPLDRSCSTNSESKKPKLSVSTIVAIVAASLILIGVCLITIMNMKARRRRRSRREEETMIIESTPLASSDSNVMIGKLVLFSKSLPSKYEDWEAGTKALLDKDSLIGKGSIGSVYRADFEGGISIAVKKIKTLGRIKNQDEFEQEIGRLGSLRHSNLVAFQGYYWSSSMQLILSDYASNGNLYDNLHGVDYPGTSFSVGNRELNWPRRFTIALGTARALSYIHHDCKPQILHLNLKSNNILLDENYEPKLSDYGLVKLLPLLDNYGLTRFHNAVGYVAPELAQSMRLSDKCDVYSFGVILLEVVTGRKPVENLGGHEVVVLCEYVRSLIERGKASDCFDRSLNGFVENELIQVMKLGLICTSESPLRRPSMAEVVQVLESVRSGSGS